MPSKCPRCSADCTCRKKRRKPRVGRAARSKPIYVPPPTQSLYFGMTPAMQQAQQFARPDLRELPSVPYEVGLEAGPRVPRVTEITSSRGVQAGPERAEMEVQAGPERAEMEVQTDEIMVPVGRGALPLEKIEAMVESGEKTLSLRPARYLPRTPRGLREAAGAAMLARLAPPPSPPSEEDAPAGGAAGGGGAVGGGPDPAQAMRAEIQAQMVRDADVEAAIDEALANVVVRR